MVHGGHRRIGAGDRLGKAAEPLDGLQAPVNRWIGVLAFEGATTTLVWADPNGFYKNYSIKQALYYRTSGYLVIETSQPIRAGYDEITMHGVMIFSVAPVARP